MVIKTRYFNLMKVYDVTGKYLGSVQDIAIDFYSGMVTGVIINSFSINKKKNYRLFVKLRLGYSSCCFYIFLCT